MLDAKYVPGLTQDIYKDVDGFLVQDLIKANNYPDKPDEENAVADINFQGGDNSIGEKIFGYFKPPEDGVYTFKICK